MVVKLNQLSMSRMSGSRQADAGTGTQGTLRRPTVVDLFLEGAEAKTRTEVASASKLQAVQAMATAPRSGSVCAQHRRRHACHACHCDDRHDRYCSRVLVQDVLVDARRLSAWRSRHCARALSAEPIGTVLQIISYSITLITCLNTSIRVCIHTSMHMYPVGSELFQCNLFVFDADEEVFDAPARGFWRGKLFSCHFDWQKNFYIILEVLM